MLSTAKRTSPHQHHLQTPSPTNQLQHLAHTSIQIIRTGVDHNARRGQTQRHQSAETAGAAVEYVKSRDGLSGLLIQGLCIEYIGTSMGQGKPMRLLAVCTNSRQ